MAVVKCLLLLASGLAMATQGARVGLVIGGFGASDNIEVVTPDSVCLSTASQPKIPQAPVGREGWTAQYFDNSILLCGGEESNKCYSLHDGAARWVERGSMRIKRKRFSSLVFNGKFLALGGYSLGQGWIPTVEMLDKSSGVFQIVRDWRMPRGLFDFCAVQIDQHRIMVLGGNQEDSSESADMDILDTTTNTWTRGPDMPKATSGHSCLVTSYGGERGVMVSGGCERGCIYKSVDVSFFGFDTWKWTKLPDLVEGRYSHALVGINGVPTVIGGYQRTALGTIEQFDGLKWSSRPDHLKFARSHFAIPDEYPFDIKC